MRRISRDAVGIGFRPVHSQSIVEQQPPDIDFFEILADNFLEEQSASSRNLARITNAYPVVLHSVGLNLLGHDSIDQSYFSKIRDLATRCQARYWTEHLCWTSNQGRTHHDLLPVPHVRELVNFAVNRTRWIQQQLQIPFGLENLSSYVQFKESELTECQFYCQVVEQSGCHFMLDINNVYVSSINHDFCPYQYLDQIDFSKVLQVHLAGHAQDATGLLIDTHDHAVCDEVWDLYKYAWTRGGPFPTLIEWDSAIPDLDVLRAEVSRARRAQQSVAKTTLTNLQEQTPPRLEQFQQEFAQALTTPFKREGQNYRPQPNRYNSATLYRVQSDPRATSQQRIQVYNQQYWFRLLNVLQKDFPLVNAIMGPWNFNALAIEFFEQHPPSQPDLFNCCNLFVDYCELRIPQSGWPLEPQAKRLERSCILEAAKIDETFRYLTRVPSIPGPVQISAQDLQIPGAKLVAAQGWALVEESRPLIELRARAKASTQDTPYPLPRAYDHHVRHWLISAQRYEHRVTAIDRICARLLHELSTQPFSSALASLEHSLNEQDRIHLLKHVGRWLEQSQKLGLWSEFERSDEQEQTKKASTSRSSGRITPSSL